jgi:hypothetical protein
VKFSGHRCCQPGSLAGTCFRHGKA